mgnify:FL=1
MNKKLEYFIESKLSKIIKKYSEEEIFYILDSRDNDSFSDKWMQVYEELKVLCPESKSYGLRKRFFSIVNENSIVSDLASYVSDDFGLFSDALQINYNNAWLNGLWIKYKEMEIPHGEIDNIEGNLNNLLG